MCYLWNDCLKRPQKIPANSLEEIKMSPGVFSTSQAVGDDRK